MTVTGCSADTGATAGGSAPSAASPAASTAVATRRPSATVPLSPAAWGEATYVSGTESISITEGTVTRQPDGTVHSRGGTTVMLLESDDPRVAGTMRETWDHDRWGTASDGALVESGTATLTNPAGTWVGTFSGVYTSATTDVVTWWLVGSGGYEGLSLFRWVIGSGSGSWSALVFPGSPPPQEAMSPGLVPSAPASSATPPPVAGLPTPIAYGPTTFVSGSYQLTLDEGEVSTNPDGSSASRGGTTTSTIACADPRAAGRKSESWDSNRWGTVPQDGALVQWGTGAIVNEGGAWVGNYTGVATSLTGDVITWWLMGTGDYAGLSMFRWINGSNGTWSGLIFPGTPPSPSTT